MQAGEDGECPTCERTLHDHYRTVLDRLDEQIDALVADGKYFKSRLEQLEEMPDEVRELDERRRAVFDEVSKLERRLAKVQLAVQELAQVTRDLNAKDQRLAQVRRDREADAWRLRRRAARCRRAVSSSVSVRSTPARRDSRRSSSAEERSRRSAIAPRPASPRRRGAPPRCPRGATCSRSPSRATPISARGTTLPRQSCAPPSSTPSSAAGEAAGAQAALARAEQMREDLQRARGQLGALEREKRLHDELDRAYTDLRTDLNVQLRPEMSELASAFLTELTDARYDELELDDSYNLTVIEDGVPKPVISGGEQDIANLCLRLAISQMIAERAGQSFSLLILDEVFGSLDESRRQNVVELLRGLQDRFEQVILITHIEQVREGLDRVISVRYDEESGTSVVTQSDPSGVDGSELLATAGAED